MKEILFSRITVKAISVTYINKRFFMILGEKAYAIYTAILTAVNDNF